MRTPKIKFFFFASTAFAFGLLLVNCAGYQNATYYPSDGIYGDPVRVVPKTEASNGKYYKQYFQNMGDTYSSTSDDAVYFTDPDSYINPETAANQPTQQIPWGGQITGTDVYIFNNRPAFGFGFSNFGWGFNSFGFGYDPFFYGYNPYFGYSFRSRFYNPWWNGFSPFYDPFYSPFYNPYYNGFAGLHYRSPFYRNYYDNRFYRNNHRGNYTPYAGVSNSRRGEKGYGNSRENNNRNQRAQNTQKRNNEFATRAAINRLNIGRSSMYLNGVPYVARESSSTKPIRGTSVSAVQAAPANGRNLQQYGVQPKASAPQQNTQGRRFTPSRYTNSSAIKDVRSSNRNVPVRQNNYRTPSQQYNYSNRSSTNNAIRSTPSRSTNSYRSSSINRGRSTGRRN